MSARLTVDTDLVRGYGTSSSGQADDLHDVARTLSGLGGGDMLGPVGARFLAALVHAAAGEAAAVAALSSALTGVHGAAHGAAGAYEDSDTSSGTRLTGFW